MVLRKGAGRSDLVQRIWAQRLWAGSAAMAALMISAAGAQAADKLIYGPPEAWVRPAVPGAINPAQAAAPTQLLLVDNQVHFAADGDSTYGEYAIRVQTPAGLQGLQPEIVWNPDTDTVTIHKAQILRGDQVIDLLKTTTFTVLRRETNLERSMLDGALTGALQPEGLQVGDTLVYAMTVRHQDPVLKGHSEAILAATATVPAAHTEIRTLWDAAKPIRTYESDDLPAVKVKTLPSGGEFALDLHNIVRPEPPADAPARFSALGEVEFTQFTGWDEVSALLAPLYDKASTLSTASSLKAEAARIKAASSDPKVEAAAALRLVQNQVRYLFLGMNMGGYIPADADTTWTRRFGDCKGKTALLLALLHELGIKAEPAVVSTEHGDGLNGHLPMLEWFDHVMVRADIGGKVYWLDGTRLDDRDVDSIAVPDFGFALPVRATGGALEALKPVALTEPSEEFIASFDASAGLGVPARAHVETLYRGDEAIGLHETIDAAAGLARDKALRDYWAKLFAWITVQKVAAGFDPKTGIERITMDGAANMQWDWDDATRTWRYEADGARLGWGIDTKRESGLHADAPYVIRYPIYYHSHETIILPKGGKGFATEGDVIDKSIGGGEFKRSLGIRDGVLHIDVTRRSLVPELSAAQTAVDGPVLTAMYKKGVYLVAPEGYKSGAGETAKLAGNTTRSAGDLVNEAAELRQQNKDDQALGRYNQALQLEPANAQALLGRAQLFLKRKAYAATLADAQQALKSDPSLWQACDVMAAVYLDQDKKDEALDAYTRALAIYPNDTFALDNRAMIYGARGDKDKARADATAVLQIDPGHAPAVRILVALAMQDKKLDDAKALLRTAIDANPDNVDLYEVMAEVDRDCEGLDADACKVSRTDAVVQYDKIIAIEPSAHHYIQRAWARPAADVDARFGDLDQAVKLAPDTVEPYVARARQSFAGKAYDKALTDLSQALAIDARATSAYGLRQQIYFVQGKTDLALDDLDKVAAAYPDSGEDLNNVCWQRATHNLQLDKALAECDAAVKAGPKNPAFIDSHGFVELRLGHYDQAIADYDAALAIAPTEADSLYGRGIAKLRKGKTQEGQADLAAARKVYAKIDDIWVGYGIKP